MRCRALAALAVGTFIALCAGPAAAQNADSTRFRGIPTNDYVLLMDRSYATLLGFVHADSIDGRLSESRVDYRALRASPAGLIPRTHDELITHATPSRMARCRRMAWAIDAYNFLVLETVTRHLFPLSDDTVSTRPVGSIRDIRIHGREVFEAPLVEVEGVTYSLDAFERYFVFDGWDPKSGVPRPGTLDPRAHFALVCAARGCPPLRSRPYEDGDVPSDPPRSMSFCQILDHELDQAARDALANPSHLRWIPGKNRLEASEIFDWYAADFGGPDGVMAFIRKYAPESVRREIKRHDIHEVSAYIPWDWRLNDRSQHTGRR